MTPIPTWLEHQLIHAGHLHPDRINRHLRARPCRCGATIAIALDADTCAFEARIDPYLLTPATELAALLTGRRTYRLWPEGNRWSIQPRDQWNLRHPPGPNVHIAAAHHCHKPPLSAQPIPALHISTTTEDQCPF